ncbi:MAG: peptidoglycan-binding protein [Variibacter sp.]|nr:peptidoglycan-binding protein [Variibacter sp.]
MKSPFATGLTMAVLLGPALAQAAPPAAAKPKPAATAPARPAVQTPADTAKAMTAAERLAIQSDLAWTSHYNGAINGEVSERMIAAIKAFQKAHGAKPTGVLNPQERGALADAAKKLQDHVGWKIVSDPVTGARLGVPTKLVPAMLSDGGGTKWSSATGTIQIELSRRREAGATIAGVAEAEKKRNARKTDYSAVRPDFFVLSGLQGLKKFYIRGQIRDSEVRVLTVLYDQATEGTMTPVTVAMSSAFNPFPGSGAAANGPPPRRKVEYSTGVVVSTDGAILAEHDATDGCMTIAVPGHGNATRVADDEGHGLALLRIYGASGLKPLALGGGATKPAITLTGIADPQSQGGRSAVSSVTATVGSDSTLTPEPAPGFSGAAAIDSDGRFAGLARLKPATVAGATGTPLPAQALLIPADSVRAFLTAKGVIPASGASDAKAAVLRLVCVRN